MVKFAMNGSDVTTAEIKLARAATGGIRAVICGSQPFFSVDGSSPSTKMMAGITSGGLTITCRVRLKASPKRECVR
jgi:glutamate-1-semialdehyde 2,1-aminomutase